MNPERWQRLKQIAEAAFALPEARQQTFAQAACENDEELLHDVLQLLANDRAASEFLRPPPFKVDDDGDPSPARRHTHLPTFAPGTRIAGRYELREEIGRGAWGVVHEALDQVAKRTVAVKLIPGMEESTASALRREAATLRWLRLPGVVQLLDDGIENGTAFLVTERVRGTPFPGEGRLRTWEAISETVLALLETLARVHWAGVVHRDLKPHNVLVDDRGVPTVLDLGVSVGPPVVWDPDADIAAAGTPRYAAPEQICGSKPTARADLYSLGVMIYEALSGKLPHDASSLTALVTRRLTAAPASLVETSVPPHVSELLARLLEVDPDKRPASAIEAWSMLRREPGPVARELPWLGGEVHLATILDAAHERRCMDVVGRPGSGRTRCLREATKRLESEGYEVVWLTRSRSPFASLEGLLGDTLANTTGGLEAATRKAADDLARALESGLVLVADDVEQIDRWSAAAIQACRHRGCVLRALLESEAAGVLLGPLSEENLRGLFAGPDRIHHLREDAAQQLLRRTDGWPDRVARELEAWVRAGLARREEDKFVISRNALERLAVGEHIAPAETAAARPPELDPQLEELLGCIEIAGHQADPQLLTRVTGRPLWRIEAEVDELSRIGLVRTTPDRRVVALGAAVHQAWDRDRKTRTHAAMAASLPAGSPGRILHLVASEQLGQLPGEAAAVARHLLLEGQIERAVFVLDEGLRAVVANHLPHEAVDLLALSLKAALAAGTIKAFDHLLYQIQRVDLRDPVVGQIETIARAAWHTLDGDQRRALAAVHLLQECHPALAHSRAAVHVLASRYTSLEAQADAVAKASAWAAAEGREDAEAAALQWRGWLHYGNRQYDAATQLHMRAAALVPEASGRVAALLAAAAAALEGFDLENAAVLARRASAQARELRIPNHEAQAECLLRSAAYRLDDAGGPDTELTDALRELGVPQLEAQGCLTEAAVAWRSGLRGMARALARRAADEWRHAGLRWPSALASCLEAVCGGGTRAASLIQGVGDCPVPGIAVQIMGMATRLQPELAPEHAPLVHRLAGLLPRDQWRWRREVVSVNECLEWTDRAAGTEEKGGSQ